MMNNNNEPSISVGPNDQIFKLTTSTMKTIHDPPRNYYLLPTNSSKLQRSSSTSQLSAKPMENRDNEYTTANDGALHTKADLITSFDCPIL